MRNREDPGWKRVAEVLERIAKTHEDDRSSVVSAVSGQVSSSSGSAERRPKESESSDPLERDYVEAVLDCYLRLPGTSSVTSRYDRRCAQQLYRRGVPLEVVRSAMVVAVARRTFRRGGPLPRVRAVHYFMPVIEEMLEFPCDPGYVQYLEQQLRPLAAAKLAGETPSGPSS
jgi:hypothetical protein